MKYAIIHIPKTAGTLLRQAIPDPKAKYYYSWENKGDICIGHYSYDWIKEQYPDAKTACVVREPASQYVSNYYHYARNPSVLFEPQRKAITPGLSLEEFILHPQMKNYQSQFVPDPKKIDCICTQDDMDKTIARLSNFIGKPLNKPRQKINTGNYDRSEVERVKDLVYKTHKKDVELYKYAKSVV